jgi:hypothetical protein
MQRHGLRTSLPLCIGPPWVSAGDTIPDNGEPQAHRSPTFAGEPRPEEAAVATPTEPTPMTGALAANFYQGSRSEYLAQYMLSVFGTSLLVPRQEDYGLDLFCALTERIGRRARPYAYYAVQVKSAAVPWRIGGRESVNWLVNYPTPLIYCVVGKKEQRLRAYQTSARFLASVVIEPLPKMDLIPGKAPGSGRPTPWDSAGNFDLGPPILDLTVDDLRDRQLVTQRGEVLRAWVLIDQANIRRRRMGIRSSSMPPNYTTNEVPPVGGRATASLTGLTPEIRALADETAVDLLNWLGMVMINDDDRVGAVLAGMLCRHLLGGQPGARPEEVPWLYSTLLTGGWLDAATGAGGHLTASLEKLLRELREQLSGTAPS